MSCMTFYCNSCTTYYFSNDFEIKCPHCGRELKGQFDE